MTVVLARLRRDPAALAALALLSLLALLAVSASWLAPFDPNTPLDVVALKNRAPSWVHPLGTDPFSRDVLSRVLHGAQVSLGVGLAAALLASTLGTAYGAVAGWVGGAADAIMMRVVDACLGVPRVLVLLAVVAIWGRVEIPTLVLLLAGTGWFATSRLARDQTRALRGRDYVHAARALGTPGGAILRRHIAPQLVPLLLVTTTLAVANVIALEAGLSYLGLGIRPPQSSWGSIMQDGFDSLPDAWWTTAAPATLVILTVLAVNVLGDALRDALDPRD